MHGCFGFPSGRARGPTVAALSAWFRLGKEQSTDMEIAVQVNGKEIGEVKSTRTICVPVPGSALFTDSPSVILEVLSPTTGRIDEVQKSRDYITIPTLNTYILAESDTPFLTLHRRDGADFRREAVSGLDAVLQLPEVGIAISLAEPYRDVS